MPVQEVGKVQFECHTLHKVEAHLNTLFYFLGMGGFIWIPSILIICICIIILLSVAKLAIATGDVMKVFNDLYYSNHAGLLA
jgi:hypothetical protein